MFSTWSSELKDTYVFASKEGDSWLASFKFIYRLSCCGLKTNRKEHIFDAFITLQNFIHCSRLVISLAQPLCKLLTLTLFKHFYVADFVLSERKYRGTSGLFSWFECLSWHPEELLWRIWRCVSWACATRKPVLIFENQYFWEIKVSSVHFTVLN